MTGENTHILQSEKGGAVLAGIDMVADKEKLSKLDEYIDTLKNKNGILINVLHKAQEIFGYLPDKVIDHIADRLNLPPSKIFGVVTFYNFFSRKPKGKYQVKICLGTACYVKGAGKILERFLEELGVQPEEVTQDGLFSVHPVRCLGACSMAPVVLVGERDFYGRLTPSDVPTIIKKYREG